MPHCVIEHSDNFDGNILLALVHQGASASNLFEAEGSDIKVRSLSYSTYQTGSENITFVHVTLKILSGRNQQQKAMLSKLVLGQLKTLALSGCSLSVEVADIDKASYAKVII